MAVPPVARRRRSTSRPSLPPGHAQAAQGHAAGHADQVGGRLRQAVLARRTASAARRSRSWARRTRRSTTRPPSGSPGVLFGFVGGDQARKFAKLSTGRARREAVLGNFVTYFGDEARKPERPRSRWTGRQEALDAGLPGRRTPACNVLHRYGPELRKPFGHVHWAGTEMATYWNGYMDGAVRSGEAGGAKRCWGRCGGEAGAPRWRWPRRWRAPGGRPAGAGAGQPGAGGGARPRGLSLRHPAARVPAHPERDDERESARRQGQRAGERARQRAGVRQAERPHGGRSEPRHPLLARAARPRQGADRPEPPEHGAALLRLRVRRPVHERHRLRRHAHDRHAAGALPDRLDREAGQAAPGCARDSLEVPPGLDDRADARHRRAGRPAPRARQDAPLPAVAHASAALAPAGEATQAPAPDGWPGPDGRPGQGAGGEPAAASATGRC